MIYVYTYLRRREEIILDVQMLHVSVKIVEILVPQKLVIHKIELAPRILEANTAAVRRGAAAGSRLLNMRTCFRCHGAGSRATPDGRIHCR